jgi:hypothetical protein
MESQERAALAVIDDRPETPVRRQVRTALRGLEGRATIGDVVEATRFHTSEVEATLKELLSTYQGHLEVGEHGDLVYRFDPGMIRRDHVSLWTRVREGVKAWLTQAFKVWIMLMLVVYFVVFVVLVIAAFVAIMSRGNDNRRLPGGRGHGGHFRLPMWWLFWGRGWGRRRHYYGARWARKTGAEIPFYRKVFAFVFGPDTPELTRQHRDRSLVRLIRARRGVLTSTEMVQHTGSTVVEAEEEMGRLMGAYGGDVRVSEDGELLYTFPDLMVSAHGPVTAREPAPAWRRLERPLELTGNERKDDTLIAGLNGFNLLMAALAPGFIFPALQIGGPLAWIGLVAVPLAFSALFFGIPLVRRLGLKRENARRERRNVRKLLAGSVFEGGLLDRAVEPGDAYRQVSVGLGRDPGGQVVQDELQTLAAEFDADVVAADSGELRFRFPAIRRAFLAAARLRDRLALGGRGVGEIVYSSADDDAAAGARELASFDRELAGYVGSPSRVDYFDELELIEFEQELARTSSDRGSTRRR